MRPLSTQKLIVILLAFSVLAPSTSYGEEGRPQGQHQSAQAASSVSERLRQLEEALDQQKTLITQQQTQIRQLEDRLLQQGERLRVAGQGTEEKAASAEKAAAALNGTVNDLKNKADVQAKVVQETQKKVKDLENPVTLRYKGLTLTPSGYLAADFLVRGRNQNADMTGSFGTVPFDGVANSHLSEFRASSRGSRIGVLLEGMVGKTKLNGYYEIDFLGQAPTANQVQTNSFTPRQRQLWAQASFRNGLTFTAGQFFSLITTDRKGLATRAEYLPNTVDGSYAVGFNYARQTAFRVTKNFNDQIWAAVELANSETSQPNASFVPANLFGFNNSANAGSPNSSTLNFLSGSTNGFSTNLAPDVLAKVAWEPGWGHYELKGLGRFFRDRISGKTNYSYGGGLGAAAILPVVAKKVDVTLQSLVGTGIGRYASGNGSDVTLRPNGVIVPLHAFHILAGVELHPQPKLDIFFYGGDEYYRRASYVDPTSATKPAGYGSSLVNNTNCGVEVIPTGGAACGAQNKNLWEATAGFWYRFYKGPFGTLQYGLQYESLHRTTWSGIGGAPEGKNNAVLSSLRFLLP